MVTAEKNTNPFANNNTQNVCSDPTLPATAELRGITPLIDPAVDVDGAVAALSKQTAASPLNADGLSVFDLLVQAGFGDLVKGQAAAGGAAAGNANGNANANANANGNANGNANASKSASQQAATGAACPAGSAAAATTAAAAASKFSLPYSELTSNPISEATATAGAAAGAGTAAASAGGASVLVGGEDFGQCTPTIIFEAGQPGRKPDEFTFQIADTLARGGQQDALNPDIITNALCNQLTNVCGANAAAVTACGKAKAAVTAAGSKRDKSTADLFNASLGFAGAVTNPDGGPADVTAAAKPKRAMRRGYRASM